MTPYRIWKFIFTSIAKMYRIIRPLPPVKKPTMEELYQEFVALKKIKER